MDLFDTFWENFAPEKYPIQRDGIVEENIITKLKDWHLEDKVFLLPLYDFKLDAGVPFTEVMSFVESGGKRLRWFVNRWPLGPAPSGEVRISESTAYKVDLFCLRRRLYEQQSLDSSIIELLDPLDELRRSGLAGKISEEELNEILKQIFLTAVCLEIYDDAANSGKKKRGRPSWQSQRNFSPYPEMVTRPMALDDGDEEITQYRVRINEQFLDLMLSVPFVVFDWEYMKNFEAEELRFCELTNLLRAVSAGGWSDTLEIDYRRFAQLMPLPVPEKFSQVKRQIGELCAGHLEKGFLEKYRVIKSKDSTDSDNPRLVFTFA